MEARQSSLLIFIENQHDIFARSISLFIGSFITLIFLINLFHTEPALYQPVVSKSHSQNVTSNPSIPDNSTDSLENDNSTSSIDTNIENVNLTINKHEHLRNLLLKHGLTLSDFKSLMALPQVYLALSELKDTHILSLELKQHQLQNLHYQIDKNKTLIVEHEGKQWQSVITSFNKMEQFHILSGQIHNASALNALLSAGLSHIMFYHLQNLFYDQIDLTKLPSNTSFKLVLSETLNHQKKLLSSELIAAEFITPKKSYTVVKDLLSKGNSQFYTANGKSIEKGFLRSPVHYTHISSPFSLHRMQPILGIIRPHYGVDFAAPYGSKALASSNGIITYAGYENGFGNVIKLKFNNEYSTVYGHLAHFAAGIHSGKHVKEGDILGYVGSSGLSTGSHLHYEFHVNGKPVDPLTIKLPFGQAILISERAIFKGFAQRILKL